MRTRFNKALLNGVVATRARRMRSEPTDAERRLWERLRRDAFGVKFKRQYAIGGYITDFCCPRHKLIIELDGGQHMENSNYDEQRSQELAKNGFRVLRFWNSDVMGNLDGVIESIEEALHNAGTLSPSPLPWKNGRGSKKVEKLWVPQQPSLSVVRGEALEAIKALSHRKKSARSWRLGARSHASTDDAHVFALLFASSFCNPEQKAS